MMNSDISTFGAERLKDIFAPSVITVSSSKDRVIYKGSDLLARISTVEIPERTIKRLSIQVYTDGATNITSIMKPEGSEIVSIDGLMYLVITADKLKTLNDGILYYTAMVGISNDAFPDFIQDVVIENSFNYTLLSTKVTLPSQVDPIP